MTKSGDGQGEGAGAAIRAQWLDARWDRAEGRGYVALYLANGVEVPPGGGRIDLWFSGSDAQNLFCTMHAIIDSMIRFEQGRPPPGVTDAHLNGHLVRIDPADNPFRGPALIFGGQHESSDDRSTIGIRLPKDGDIRDIARAIERFAAQFS